MSHRLAEIVGTKLCALVLACVLPTLTTLAHAATQTPVKAQRPLAASTPYRFAPTKPQERATLYYGAVWGIESLSVKLVESGEIVRFSYYVLDADKAKPLNDKKSEPSLIDPGAGVKLVVPSLEQVGQLRQSSTPEPGRSYWMAFSNSGQLVKRGDRVDVVIGQFHANGLIVE
jgi:hypothetical protein